MKKVISILMLCACFSVNNVHAQMEQHDVTVIELIQTEGKFETQKLNLTAGKYQFRVVNKDVDKDLGFVIQKEKDKNADVSKTAVINSFTSNYVRKNKAEYTGIVELLPGKYVYSCPLNPTPHYLITVN